MSEHDDFWGDQADWQPTARARHEPTSEHAAIGDDGPVPGTRRGVASRLWNSLLGGDATTRTHGRHHGIDRTGADGADAVANRFADDPTPSLGTGAYLDFDDDEPIASTPRMSNRDSSISYADDDDVHEWDTTSWNTDPAWNVDAADEWDDGWDVEPAPVRAGVDPLLAKFGGVAVVLTLLVPVLIGFRSGSSSGDELRAAPVASEETAPAPIISIAGTDSSAPATTVVVPQTDAATPSSDATEVTAASSTEADTDPATNAAEPQVAQLSDGAPTADDDAGAVASPASADEPADRAVQSCPVEYEVGAGDFWIHIADGAGVSIDDLLSLNGATTDTPLYPGGTICLPAGSSTPTPPVATTAAPTTAAPTTAAPTTATPTTAAPTTAAPTTTAPTTAAPTAPPVSASEVEQIIRDVWPDELEDKAIDIAWRESNHRPNAHNYCCYGLFQIYWDVHQGWLGDMGITSAAQLYDAETNARAAYMLYQRANNSWGPWGG